MLEVAKVIRLIRDTPSYLDKQYLLKKNERVEGLKEILRHLYDPYNKTGISVAKLDAALVIATARGSYVMGNEPFVSWKDMLKYFSTHQTGTNADLAMAARFINCTKAMYGDYPFSVELAKGIVTQELRTGISVKTLNAVFGEHFIPTVGCMLGTNLSSIPSSKVAWPCIVTEKLDGIRRIMIKRNGVCRFYSRSGHEDTSLVDIAAEAAFLPDNRVYDGELLALGNFTDNIALRQASMSRSAGNGPHHGLSFNIFDMLPIEEFYAGVSDDNALTRKILLGATLMDDSIQLLDSGDAPWPMLIQAYGIHHDLSFIRHVPILGYAKNMSDVEPIVADIWQRGGEGVMLNIAEGSYEIKRSKGLLKVKHTEEMVLMVVDMVEGTGKFEDMLGALIVLYKGSKVGVGSGFTDAMRKEIWENPDRYINKLVEVETFGESTNLLGGKSINCPIFKQFVDLGA